MSNPPAPLRPKSQTAFLRACLKNWRLVVSKPNATARLLRLSRVFTDKKIREILSWLVSTDGNWPSVREALRRKPYAASLFAWVDKIKGGAL